MAQKIHAYMTKPINKYQKEFSADDYEKTVLSKMTIDDLIKTE